MIPCERHPPAWPLGLRVIFLSQLLPRKETEGALRHVLSTWPPPHESGPAWCGPGVCSPGESDAQVASLPRSCDPPKEEPIPSRFSAERAKLLEKP